MPRIRLDKTNITDTDTDDAEGNGAKVHGANDGVEDDTEGNCFRGNISDGVEDDTEGNTLKSGRSVPPAANPGKSTPPNV